MILIHVVVLKKPRILQGKPFDITSISEGNKTQKISFYVVTGNNQYFRSVHEILKLESIKFSFVDNYTFLSNNEVKQCVQQALIDNSPPKLFAWVEIESEVFIYCKYIRAIELFLMTSAKFIHIIEDDSLIFFENYQNFFYKNITTQCVGNMCCLIWSDKDPKYCYGGNGYIFDRTIAKILFDYFQNRTEKYRMINACDYDFSISYLNAMPNKSIINIYDYLIIPENFKKQVIPNCPDDSFHKVIKVKETPLLHHFHDFNNSLKYYPDWLYASRKGIETSKYCQK